MSKAKVFISYAHGAEDDEWVRRFAQALREQSVEVWYDAERVKWSDPITDAIEAGLRDSDAIVAILSRANALQPSVLFDLGVAIAGGKRLIPIVPADLESSAIPAEFRRRRHLTKGAPDEAAREVAEALKGKAA